MATGAGAEGLFRPIYEGCISGFDSDVERRPYHKNCSCALHSKKLTNRKCAHKFRNLSYPIRRAWSDGSLAITAASASASASASSSSPPPQLSPNQDRQSNKLGVLFEM